MQDPDFKAWGDAWRARPESLGDLEAQTRRGHRKLLAWIVTDAVAIAALIGLGGWMALSADDATRRVVGVALALFGLAGGPFLWFNWRGSFGSAAGSAREHVRLQRRRALARLRYARVSWGVFVLQTLLLGWAFWSRMQADPDWTPKLSGLVLLVVAFAVGIAITLWIQVRARRRLMTLDALARKLEEE